jgi:ribosomal protein S18 acetylase RimI-like enzyme
VRVVPLEAEHSDALLQFFRSLPDADRTFIKEEVTDPATVRAMASAGASAGVPAGAAGEGRGRRWVTLGEGGTDVTGYVAVLPLAGWSDHVGEIRLVVAPASRGSGLGRDLARHALVQAVEAGLTKLIVEVVADQGPALALFTGLGFSGEALLQDQIRDRDGQLRDLMVLAHHVPETWSRMDTVGVTDAVGAAAG